MMCYRPCKQCLSSTRRSIQQHTLLPQDKVSIVRLHSQASKRGHSSKTRAKQHAHYQKTKPFQMHELSSSQSSLTSSYSIRVRTNSTTSQNKSLLWREKMHLRLGNTQALKQLWMLDWKFYHLPRTQHSI